MVTVRVTESEWHMPADAHVVRKGIGIWARHSLLTDERTLQPKPLGWLDVLRMLVPTSESTMPSGGFSGLTPPPGE